MKFPLPLTTFPAIKLSEEDEDALERVAEVVVKQTVAQYHEHLTRHHGVVDETRWKKIKQRDNVRVYYERNRSKTQQDDDLSGDGDLDDQDRVMPLMLAFGTMPGTLDDVMYGALNPTTDEMMLKTAYVEDGFVDWRVIAPIIKPTPESPFRELSIKWHVKGHSLLLGTVLRNRDTVHIESIGYAQTPNGERIGYHLRHSVTVPGARELVEYNIVRASLSFCHLFRQLPNNTVEVFVQGRIEPMGDASVSVTVATSAEVPLSVANNVHCAEMKKLTRILRSKQTNHSFTNATSNSNSLSSSESSSSASQPSTAAPASASTCSMCSKSVGGRVASLTSSGKEKHCRICRQRVCSRCRVYKDIFLRTELEKDVSCTTMAFCTRCIVMASKASSVQFAEYDARVYAGKPVDEFEFDLGI